MKRVLTSGALMALMALGTVPWAMAQNGATPGSREMLAEFEERNGNGILDEDIESLSPAEMINRGERKVATMGVTLEATTALLEEARQESRDIIKINCISENLASMRGFMNVGESSLGSLRESGATNDVEGARHHYTLVSIAGQRVAGLGEQARVCAGEELRYADDAHLELRVDPEIGTPETDVLGDVEVLDRPPKVTPFQ